MWIKLRTAKVEVGSEPAKKIIKNFYGGVVTS